MLASKQKQLLRAGWIKSTLRQSLNFPVLSASVTQHLTPFLQNHGARHASWNLGLYAPLPYEVDITNLSFSYSDQTSFPKVKGHHLFFYKTSLSQLVQGSYGILEPVEAPHAVMWSPNDIVLVPGIYFDELGYRLGRGKGYYDRFFQVHPQPLKIGITVQACVQSRLPSESWDVLMDYLCTEEGLKQTR